MKILLSLLILASVMIVSSCHKERNLILQEEFDSIGNWELIPDSTSVAQIENGQLRLYSDLGYEYESIARLQYNPEDTKKICFEMDFNTFSSVNSEDWLSGNIINIQFGNLQLSQGPGAVYGSHSSFTLDNESVHFEINKRQKKFRVYFGDNKTDISHHFTLREVSDNKNQIEFRTHRSIFMSFGSSSPSTIEIERIKIYGLR